MLDRTIVAGGDTAGKLAIPMSNPPRCLGQIKCRPIHVPPGARPNNMHGLGGRGHIRRAQNDGRIFKSRTESVS
jgi:hypothetical protein